MRQNFFRILFFIFFNWLLFFSLSLNSYFIYPALNLLIIFFIYEFYLQKKTNKEILQKFKNLTNDNTSDINFLPASEHPIIKAAKQRLKD